MLDDASWEAAKPQTDFRTATACDQVKYPTTFRALVKDYTLYLGVECKQDTTAPTVEVR